MRPVAEGIDYLFNQVVDLRTKELFGMKAYDPSTFPNPEEFEWRPDGVIMTKPGKNISQGIYEFRSTANPQTAAATVDLVALLKNYAARESGITPEAQGAADQGADQKVGIYFGNLQQIADRLGLINKSYGESALAKGLRYAWGLKEHLREPMMVKMIGEAGVEWEELTRGEAQKSPDLDLDITGGQAEVMANEAKSAKRERALDRLLKTNLLNSVNPMWITQEILRGGSYEDADIKVAMAKENTNIEVLAEASQAIQEILANKKPKLNRGADTAFMQKILDYATDNDVKKEVYIALIRYAYAHKQIVIENLTRKVMIARATASQPEPTKTEVVPGVAVPEGAGAGVSGNEATNLLRGNI